MVQFPLRIQHLHTREHNQQQRMSKTTRRRRIGDDERRAWLKGFSFRSWCRNERGATLACDRPRSTTDPSARTAYECMCLPRTTPVQPSTLMMSTLVPLDTFSSSTHPEHAQVTIVVEFNQFTLVDGTHTQSSFDTRNHWWSLKQCTCQRFNGLFSFFFLKK